MQEPSALGRIVELVRDLRRRCPWDGAQTLRTLRPYLVEEVLELDHALGRGDMDAIRNELGDVLLHVAFQIVLAEEDGRFGPEDLTRQVEHKMWRRHPHLFPDRVESLGDPRAPRSDPPTWERVKLDEKATGASMLDGLPRTLPALLHAYRLQERAAGVGFDWPDSEGPKVKLREELAELEQEIGGGRPTSALEGEIGDVLFSVVNLARKLGVDPRAALERSNTKFESRFRRVEQLAGERGLEIGRASLKELDALWDEVKREPGS
jgi:MazG family protein